MSSLTIESLNDDCLKLIFSKFDLKQKLLLQCVCVHWHQVIQQLLNGQKVLKIGLKSSLRKYYTCNDVNYFIHNCPSLRSEDWINSYHISNDDLSQILIACPNIQYLYVCDCSISVSTLEWIIRQLKKIKCISMIAIHGINPIDWNRIWCSLSDKKLIHITLSDNHFADIDISELISNNSADLEELHLAYYRQSLSDLFISFTDKVTKLSLIECFRTNLVSMKALVNGNGNNIKELIVHKVPTYDENILSEFICLKMPKLKKFSYIFDSQVPYIQPIEYLVDLQELSLFSDEEYGLPLSSLLTKTMPTVKYLRLNTHLDSKMLMNLDNLFPNIEKLDFSFDRICCDCPTVTNNQNIGNNDNIQGLNAGQNNQNVNNGVNNNEIQENNFVDELNEDEPYVDDNCENCSKKCVQIMSKLEKLKYLTMNGQRIKDSAIKTLELCEKLCHIVIDQNCKELNLKLLLVTAIKMAKNHPKELISLKISDRYHLRIINIQNMPKNFCLHRY